MKLTHQALEPLASEKPKEYQSFLDYVAMGATRSISKLCDLYRNYPATDAPPTKRIETLKAWSTRNQWQSRLKTYVAAQKDDWMDEQDERLTALTRRAFEQANQLSDQIEQMLSQFQQQRVTKRSTVPDPRNPGQTVEAIYMRVNTRELRELVGAFGQLHKDLRTIAGIGGTSDKVEINAPKGTQVKAYVNVSPDDWDTN